VPQRESLKELDELNEEKARLMTEYTAIKSDIGKLLPCRRIIKPLSKMTLRSRKHK
jgi:hypothetical protein